MWIIHSYIANTLRLVSHRDAATAPSLLVLLEELLVAELVTNDLLVEVDVQGWIRSACLLSSVAILSIMAHIVHVLGQIVPTPDLKRIFGECHIHLLLDFVLISGMSLGDLAHSFFISILFVCTRGVLNLGFVLLLTFFLILILLIVINFLISIIILVHDLLLIILVVIELQLLSQKLIEASPRLMLLCSAHGCNALSG